ncbi:bifunctional diaminohydroxyphosphoribosylaminopyrimidine deaminase/5-amino-6-(5-phosphoribosylamino)uracil reductase RibD [Desulfogranum marinum]|uniref:bifunctional diaminohydroxyphosphoribosylaminopyrimidine deaminase/5-amino-6-(5-phosphoribosylamino)uracil reductase RibD n=1 Tax=Desulfogranum marinum TaxID=453220 RepID=UPI0029C69F93|nr:bifunctional diaminohydroxyphosphoribosylaminopyrimidine deaminase/5-amino-6-(5-phosphoribosylamino)uracil reductase RibD [Desulfogranum marinum]
MENFDIHFMKLAIQEAEKGIGRTSPNPAVGAVIVHDGDIIGKGYHKKAGTPHAEINALADANKNTAQATMYVTLEPCNHTGRTPPCTEAILRSGIERVVIGMKDPNPHVAGDGITRLLENGIKVECGILEKECKLLNLPFLKHISTGLPWVVMKAGVSLDGRISYQVGSGGAITGVKAFEMVHRLRDRFDAILVGVDTALIDNPSLTTRMSEDSGHDPLRVVLDSRLRLSVDAQMLRQQSQAETWVYCCEGAEEKKQKALEKNGAKVHRVGGHEAHQLDIKEVLSHLSKAGITSVLVEGGSRIHGAFLDADAVDEVYLFYAPFFIGDAGTPLVKGYTSFTKGEDNFFVEHSAQVIGTDILFHGIRRYPW